MCITKNLGEKRLSEIDFWTIKQLYDEEAKSKHNTAGWEIINRLVIICPVGARSTNTLESFNSFSEGEWDRIYNAVLKACEERQKTKASLKLEISVKAPTKTELKEIKKRTINTLSSDPLEPEQPPSEVQLTHTDILLEKERSHADVMANAGEFERDLLEKWSCIDDRCQNLRGYCFVNYSGKHYSMDHS